MLTSDNGSVYKFNLQGELRNDFGINGGKSVHVSARGHFLAVAADDGARIYNYRNGELLHTAKDDEVGFGETEHVVMEKGERFFFVSVMENSRVTMWDLE